MVDNTCASHLSSVWFESEVVFSVFLLLPIPSTISVWHELYNGLNT